MAKTINEYLTLTTSELRRLGFIKATRSRTTGAMRWTNNGQETASIQICVDTEVLPTVFLWYSYNGKPVQEKIRLMFYHSNLNPEGNAGYYYFVCPKTGKQCRKLYIVNGRFVSRSAFRPLYAQQLRSKKQRREARLTDLILKQDKIADEARRPKAFYRGKPTPRHLRAERVEEKLSRHLAEWHYLNTPN